MKQIFHTLLLCGSLLALASCGTDDLLPTPDAGTNTPGEPDARPLISINATMGAGASANTRTGHNDVFDEGIKVSWAEGDKFAIHSLDKDGKSIGSTTFTLAAGDAGKASATFEGTAPVKGESYFICYPADVKVTSNKDGFYLDMHGQKQTDNNSTAHLGKFDPMQGHLVKDDFSEISFTPDVAHTVSGHRAALMTFNLMDIPLDLGTPERIVLGSNDRFYPFAEVGGLVVMHPLSALTLDLENVTAGGQSIVAYMMMCNFSIPKGGTLTVTLEGSQKSYTFTSPEFAADKEYKRGMRYIADVDMKQALPATIAYDDTAPASANYSGGSGTAANPFLVSTAGDLKKLIENTDSKGKYFELTQDITITQGKIWTPIGTADKPFEGHFDGGDRTIGGELKGTATELGFFGKIEGATITNLHVAAKVTTTVADPEYSTGAIVGDALNSTISNCTNAGAVSGTSYVGGIVGANEGCTLINCVNTGAVTSTLSDVNYVGGIGGYSCNPTIVGCANTGSVSTSFGGGIVGYLEGGGTIRGCFNTGLITLVEGMSSIGAIVGTLADGTLSHCQYVPAAGQSAGLAACGNYSDNPGDNIAKLADLATLNGAGVTALNAGIATWLAANTGKTCFPFKASSATSTAPPVFALPGSTGGIGGIGDSGTAWN